jgi:predicted ATPase
VRVQEGRHADGIHLVQTGLERLQAQGALIRRSFYLSLLAEAHLSAGDRDAAAAVIDAAIATAEAHEDRWWLPELHRLRGSVSDGEAARAHAEAALAMARRQGSRLLERRAEDSLAAC